MVRPVLPAGSAGCGGADAPSLRVVDDAVEVRGRYPLRQTAPPGGLGQVLAAAQVLGAVVAAAWAGGLLVRLWRWDALAGAVVATALVALAAWLVRLARRDLVLVVDDDGVRLPGGRRRLPWSEVAAVPEAGRHAEVAYVVLADQRLVHLPGFPPSLVPHLAAFAAQRRSGAPTSAAGLPAPPTGAPDIGDLVRVYAEGAPALRSPGARVLAALGVAALVVILGRAAVMAVRGDGDALLDVLPSTLVVLLYGVVVARSPATRVTPEALVVRQGAFSSQTHAWAEVAAVRLPGRWDAHSSAALRDGRLVPLPGLPVDVARRLARALAPEGPEHVEDLEAPRSPRSSPPRRPRTDVDETWEGPFRRG